MKNFLFSLSLSIIVIVTTLFVTELILRASNDRPLKPPPTVYEKHDTLGWAGKKNYECELPYGRRWIPFKMNSWGFRGREFLPYEQASDKCRILFLGDSYMYGNGIEDHQRASEIFQTMDSTYYSYNLSLDAYSTDHELLLLKQYGAVIKPKAGVLFFCLNDIPFNESKISFGLGKPLLQFDSDGSYRLENVPVPDRDFIRSAVIYLRDWTELGRRIYNIMIKIKPLKYWIHPNPAQMKLGIEGMDRVYVHFDSLLVWADSMVIGDNTHHILRELQKECQKLNTKLILVTVPSNSSWTETSNTTPYGINKILDWCSQLDITAIDLYPIFYERFQEYGENLYSHDLMHWNERGNRVVAEVVLETLRDLEITAATIPLPTPQSQN